MNGSNTKRKGIILSKKTKWQSDEKYIAQRESEYPNVFDTSRMSAEEKVRFYMQVDEDETLNVFHSY